MLFALANQSLFIRGDVFVINLCVIGVVGIYIIIKNINVEL